MNILIERFVEIAAAPYYSRDMLWVIIPLVLAMIFVAIYHGRYKYEALGWHSAFGNSLILIFVSIDLMRRLSSYGTFGYLDFRNLLALAVLFEGVTLLLMGFFHLLPKRLAFDLYEDVPINAVAYIAIILVYSSIKIDLITIIDSLVFVFLLDLIFGFVEKIIPLSKTEQIP